MLRAWRNVLILILCGSQVNGERDDLSPTSHSHLANFASLVLLAKLAILAILAMLRFLRKIAKVLRF